MDYFSIILFLGLYYIRPHEWIPLFSVLQLLRISVAMAVLSMVFGERSLTFRAFFRTPFDWFMAAYFFWMVFASPPNDMWRNFNFIYNFYVFYWVTVLTLRDIPRIQNFLNWWTFFMIFVAGFAVLSEYGFDPTDSYDKTHGPMKDRLILNLGIFNNPNALGHSIVPAVVMLYFIGIWKRPIFARMTAPLAMAVPLYCTFLTLSKGAFLSGSVTLASALSFKRPKAIQLAIVVACATLGVVAVKNLPRMQELQSSKRDEAIQGRVHAFRFGFEKMQNEPYGIGYANFIAKFEQRFHYRKAAHSTYVNIGAELGKTGLFLFCALLYFSFRVLLAAKTTNDEEERVRRLLFVLLISFCVSSWMIGWHNRVTFWLMIAAIAAFHRIMLDKRAAALARQVTAPTEITPLPALAYASPQARPAGVLNQIALQANPSSTDDENAAPADPDLIGIQWNRPKWFDWIFMFAVLYGVIYMWDYAIKHM